MNGILIIMLIALITYYFVVIMKFIFDEYDEKKELHLDLVIPFRLWFVAIKEIYNDLD